MGMRSDGVRRVRRGGKPRWIIDFRFRDKAGRERRYKRDSLVQTASGARAEAERLKLRAAETGTLDVRETAQTFAAFVGSTFRPLHMPTKCRPATRERYEALLKQGILEAFGSKHLDEPWAPAMRSYAAALATRGVQSRPHLSLVRTVLRAAVEHGALDTVPELPPLQKQSNKVVDPPGDEDVAKLLTHSRGWLRVAIALATFGGMRMGEVRALEVRDVDFARWRILVKHALSADVVLPPKSGHERPVPLAAELHAILTEAVRLKLPTARIVVNAHGRTPSRQHVLTRLKALEKKLGMREWSFHSLRHYFCSTLIRRGASVEAVRQLAGHSKLDVTQRYVHANSADLASAIGRLAGH